MLGREGLAAAVERCIDILNASLTVSQNTDNSLLFKTRQVLKHFMSELERIDREVQQGTG